MIRREFKVGDITVAYEEIKCSMPDPDENEGEEDLTGSGNPDPDKEEK